MKILFDKTFIFRLMDYLRVYSKSILTKLRLRDKQSCKHCGRDQEIVWRVKDRLWYLLPLKYQNKTLCLECFVELLPCKIQIDEIEIMGYLKLTE